MKHQSLHKLDTVVISDVHLGTYGCQARELLCYLKSIKPKTLILNGDLIDIWQFSKRYWPKSHMKVVKHIMKLVSKGVKVYYVTGNHDEMLRKFEGFKWAPSPSSINYCWNWKKGKKPGSFTVMYLMLR